jgi:hypothetical protein
MQRPRWWHMRTLSRLLSKVKRWLGHESRPAAAEHRLLAALAPARSRATPEG